jgi:hypothetical protein
MAANVRQTRMNTAILYRVLVLYIGRYQFTLRNGMEEVIGSIPIRSTKLLQIHLLANGRKLWRVYRPLFLRSAADIWSAAILLSTHLPLVLNHS